MKKLKIDGVDISEQWELKQLVNNLRQIYFCLDWDLQEFK
jgi:hypothetical protein